VENIPTFPHYGNIKTDSSLKKAYFHVLLNDFLHKKGFKDSFRCNNYASFLLQQEIIMLTISIPAIKTGRFALSYGVGTLCLWARFALGFAHTPKGAVGDRAHTPYPEGA
jgi:hypothetical protein